ncbi:SUKH-3 domain-containing protein [Deinococcus hohokamensis]|uniref:SUKH-3 domain-containing protein n=1 Tax=Deinococcus hohokamensis TaxID=309883 RepID=A0ABV9I669_9DEIO
MNDVTKMCLMAAGWSNDREVDIDLIVADLLEHGWKPFQEAIQFLKSFDGLPEFSHEKFSQYGFSSYALTFIFDYEIAKTYRDTAAILERNLQIQVIPIGHQDLFAMYLGSDCCIYSLDDDLFCVKNGHSLEESLNNLFLGAYVKTMDFPED